MLNLFSSDRTTCLRFLHVEAAIFTAVKAYLKRTGESCEYYITYLFILSIWIKEVRIYEDPLYIKSFGAQMGGSSEPPRTCLWACISTLALLSYTFNNTCGQSPMMQVPHLLIVLHTGMLKGYCN